METATLLCCRTCAKSDVKQQTRHNCWLDLFAVASSSQDIQQQIQMQLTDWNLQVSFNDGLPASICDDCYAQFRNLFNFRQRCMEAYNELQRKCCTVEANKSVAPPSPTPTPLECITYECEWQTAAAEAAAVNGEMDVELSQVELNFHDDLFTFDNLIEQEADDDVDANADDQGVAAFQWENENFLVDPMEAECVEEQEKEAADVASADRLACEVCGKRYADRLNLHHHIEKYHSDVEFECTLCEKRFNSRRSLRYHSKWHDESAQLKCRHCDRLFISKRQLQCHEQTHEGARASLVGCTACDKTFVHAKTLRWHAYRQHGGEKPIKCGNCSEVFVTYLEKRLHSLEAHLSNLTAMERIECIACHERFGNEQELIKHMRSTHAAKCLNRRLPPTLTANRKRVLQQRLPQGAQSASGLLQCADCDKRFHMRSALERHRVMHSSVGRPHACHICNKRFKRAQDRNWHLKIHSNEKPHACDVCGKRFALSYVLTQHRHSHDVLEKQFTCNACGRSYLSEKSLRAHERVHSGTCHYQCDLCNLEFDTHIKLKYHMQKRHATTEVLN